MASGGQGVPSAPQNSPPPVAVDKNGARPKIAASLPLLSLGALGVVFGDIGTSPLYTLKTVLSLAGNKSDAFTVLGSLSLVIWTLIIITSIKYVTFAMRMDNDGEGGILALMSLLGVKRRNRPLIVAVGLFGAALIYGDGAITPAISVLSALEGLNMVAPAFSPYVLQNAPDAERADDHEPKRHDRPERAADLRSSQRLNGEQPDQHLPPQPAVRRD